MKCMTVTGTGSLVYIRWGSVIIIMPLTMHDAYTTHGKTKCMGELFFRQAKYYFIELAWCNGTNTIVAELQIHSRQAKVNTTFI